MKFILESTNWYKPDEIIERYPVLHRFGLEKTLIKRPLYESVRDENGKRIFQVNGYEDREKCCVYIYSLEELLQLMKSVEHELVVYYDEDLKSYAIEIYDRFRE